MEPCRRKYTEGTGRRLQPGAHGPGCDDLCSKESALLNLPCHGVLQSAPEWHTGTASCHETEEGCAALRSCSGHNNKERQSFAGTPPIERAPWGHVGIPERARYWRAGKGVGESLENGLPAQASAEAGSEYPEQNGAGSRPTCILTFQGHRICI